MHHRKQPVARRPRQRSRRAGAPSSIIKLTSSQELHLQHAKKRLLERVTPRKVSNGARSRKRSFHVIVEKQKNLRARWAAIAMETQSIVLGAGQYVIDQKDHPIPHAAAPVTGTLFSHAQSTVTNTTYELFPQIQLSRQGTIHYPHYSEHLAFWATTRPSTTSSTKTTIDFVHGSTLSVARQLINGSAPSPIGVLSFASPKKPACGYLNGADEQEDVIARHSSLIASLTSDAARPFYQEHKFYRTDDGSGLHDHSMLYSPGVIAFRADPDDSEVTDSVGGHFIPPYSINVVSSVPVNAAMVRAKHTILPSEKQFFEDGIRSAMKERMGRVLRILEEKGNRTIVLGAFGCGSSQNNVEVIASIWAELLVCGHEVNGVHQPARYKDVFDRVVFAVPGKSFQPFQSAYEMRVFEAEVAATVLSD